MSLSLDIDSPGNPIVRVRINTGAIEIGSEVVGIKDFLVMAQYVLTNTDLAPDDPRRQFVACVRGMREAEGHNGPQSVRYESDAPPIPSR